VALYRAAEALGIEVEVVAAYDSWARAVATYNANLPHAIAQVVDVKTLAQDDLPPHDLVIGGPPCQPFSDAGKRTGHDDPRNCIPDFLRLADCMPFVMENVKPRLLDPYRPGYWSEKLNASEFGDVTSRKRWFYSSHLLHVVRTPGSRRFREIRDHAEDNRIVAMRSYPQALTPIDEDGFPGSLTSHSHDQPLRSGQSHPTQDEDVMGTLTSGKGGMSGFMKVALRSHGSNYQTLHDDAFMGSSTSDSTHNLPTIPGVRCVSLLEMQRAHSFPEDFDWGNATKTDRGKMIANSIPIGMGTAVLRAMLTALGGRR